MKRPLALFALPLTAVAVAACGSSGHKATATTKNAAATTTPTQAAPPPTTTAAAPPVAPSAATAQTIELAADPSGMLKFTQTHLSAKAGKVTVDFTNKSPLPHNVVLIGSSSYSAGAKVLGQTPTFQGGTKSFTVTLTPGTYYYYCSVPGHRQAGMQGTLTVS
jgi:plastocyanin